MRAMKCVVMLSVLITMVNSHISAQDISEKEVPAEIIKSFKAKYPGQYAYEWERKKKSGVYEAEFNMDGKKYEARFTSEGIWISTSRDIKKSEVPQAVWDSIAKSEYASWDKDDCEEIQLPSGTVFRIEVEKGDHEKRIYFAANGTQVESPNR